MARALVVPDVHLKPWMFDIADNAMESCDTAVVLGDVVDDWGCALDADLYDLTIDRAREFMREHPQALWCHGNHDWCYLHFEEGIECSGFSDALKYRVRASLSRLAGELGGRAAITHRVGATVFSHAGVSASFTGRVQARLGGDVSSLECAEFANGAGPEWLWENDSPLWARPGRDGAEFDMGPGLFQVAGHTPVPRQMRVGPLLLTDTFSNYSDGTAAGNRRLTIVDTDTGAWELF